MASGKLSAGFRIAICRRSESFQKATWLPSYIGLLPECFPIPHWIRVAFKLLSRSAEASGRRSSENHRCRDGQGSPVWSQCEISNPQPNPQKMMSCATCRYFGSPRVVVSCCKTNPRYAVTAEVASSSLVVPAIKFSENRNVQESPFGASCIFGGMSGASKAKRREARSNQASVADLSCISRMAISKTSTSYFACASAATTAATLSSI
jgi:hypothetical protein